MPTTITTTAIKVGPSSVHKSDRDAGATEGRGASVQIRLDEPVRGKAGRGWRVQYVPEEIQRPTGVSLRDVDRCTRGADAVHQFVLRGESVERRARLIQHPDAGLRGRQPAGNRSAEGVRTAEERSRRQCRGELPYRRRMLPASGVQHTRRGVQEHRGRGVHVWRSDIPGVAKPAFRLVEFAHPGRLATPPAKCGREYRPILQAIVLGERDRLPAAFARGRERDGP